MKTRKHKELIIQKQKKARVAIYQVKSFRGIVQIDIQRFDVPNIAERKVKTNYDILGEQSKTNNDSVLAVSDDDKICLIEKYMINESISKK